MHLVLYSSMAENYVQVIDLKVELNDLKDIIHRMYAQHPTSIFQRKKKSIYSKAAHVHGKNLATLLGAGFLDIQ